MLYYIYTHTIYIQIYQFMSWSDRPPNLRSSDSQDQETFWHPLLTSKPATMTQSALTTIPPYQP